MKFPRTIWTVLALGAVAQSGIAWADPVTQSGQAVQQGGLASGHASGSAAHAIAASGQTTSAAMAVPLASGGAVSAATGGGSTAAAQGSAAAAGSPLPIGDEAITAMPPPDEALKNKPGKAQNGI
ncbi:MAG: hypothetical protein PHU46_01555 [Rhodocyclaceae bacterium]|nr:hypothetical protein [Rhodocyclaceae bacterium]